ncbi:MAG: transposase, partial [Candidatus Competibacteraceae bacterium]|nr:transposase [Candidatus Competibacteraceae bacterium]
GRFVEAVCRPALPGRPAGGGGGVAYPVILRGRLWGQNLHYHPHIHCIVPGGGLRGGKLLGRSSCWAIWGVIPTGWPLATTVLCPLTRIRFAFAGEITPTATGRR